MSTEGVDKSKRRFLIGATTAIGAVGAAYVAVPFLKSWNPSARARAAGAPVEADISKLQPGQQMTVEWRGKPVWVVRRTEQNLKDLETLADRLADPESEAPQQPEYADGVDRSIKPEYLVLVGICTHLGCSPTFRPEVAPEDLGPKWKGGFFCPCHGSKFDLAGRVYAGVPAPTNMVVPPHKYLSDTLILIGVDQGAA
ncbi:MAG: ubiquinol-cytochrome c reductase iron-sulfur subunit [Granulosicoccaceae bacterium]|jgi:ubiquinol-cytochrome c reductase iron-sulfur subunit